MPACQRVQDAFNQPDFFHSTTLKDLQEIMSCTFFEDDTFNEEPAGVCGVPYSMRLKWLSTSRTGVEKLQATHQQISSWRFPWRRGRSSEIHKKMSYFWTWRRDNRRYNGLQLCWGRRALPTSDLCVVSSDIPWLYITDLVLRLWSPRRSEAKVLRVGLRAWIYLPYKLLCVEHISALSNGREEARRAGPIWRKWQLRRLLFPSDVGTCSIKDMAAEDVTA